MLSQSVDWPACLSDPHRCSRNCIAFAIETKEHQMTNTHTHKKQFEQSIGETDDESQYYPLRSAIPSTTITKLFTHFAQSRPHLSTIIKRCLHSIQQTKLSLTITFWIFEYNLVALIRSEVTSFPAHFLSQYAIKCVH